MNTFYSKPNFNWLFSFCLVFLLFLSSNSVVAQCTVHGVDMGNTTFGLISGDVVGQSFQACQTGEITSISINLDKSSAGTHDLRIAEITGSPSAVIGDPVYQTFSTTGSTVTVTIPLNTPFPVTAGSDYAFDIEFDIEPGSKIEVNAQEVAPADEPSGIAYLKKSFGFTQFTTYDLSFGVEISTASSPAPASIPTLSEWGLIILALMLMTAGTLYLVQPNWRGRFER